MNHEATLKLIEKYIGKKSCMISGSKSHYRKKNPKNKVFYNACIFVRNEPSMLMWLVGLEQLHFKQIWHGDVDLTKNYDLLNKLSMELKEPVYITMESYRIGGLRTEDDLESGLMLGWIYKVGGRVR